MTMSGPEPAFVPISPNPYIVGNPIRDRAMFFGRESEFELVRSRFQHSEHGGLLVFCGERRSGKTSILFQILDGRLGPDFIPVLIDMQSMAISSEADFLGRIAQEILDALGPRAEGILLPDFSQRASHAATFQKFVEGMLRRCSDRKLILLFDEYELFENKIDSGVLGQDVLYILSSLMEHQSVFLVFTGSQHLDQRHASYWKILGKSIWKQISYLERSDAQKLICRPVEGRVDFADGTVEAIYRLSAGQPFYTQALCQSLVDLLNERKTRKATPAVLAEVVQGLVNNPLPQMIFLWDSLETDEKLTLALLAEALSNDRDHAADAALARLIRRRDYPLEMDRRRIAAALENLFSAELLSKDDSLQPPGYAFRMDLWRSWIRRMHSVWQVMREIGLDIRRTKGLRIGSWRVSPLRASLALLVVVAVAALSWRALVLREARHPGDSGASGPTGSLLLQADPGDAAIELAGQPVADRGAADRTRRQPRSPAPAHGRGLRGDDAHGAGGTRRRRASQGRAPAAARRPADRDRSRRRADQRGRISPGRQSADRAGTRARAAARRRGDARRARDRPPVRATPRGGQGLDVTLALEAGRAEVMLTSEPPGAAISMDGVPRGVAPSRLPGVALGRHQFSARLPGFTPAESTVEVSDATGQIHFALVAEPPGVLIIQGDKPANIYVDGRLVAENLQNSGQQKLPRGTHSIKVVLASGEPISKALVVNSGERVVFDFTSGSVTRTP